MRIVFIDGMGGGLVAQVISQVTGRVPENTELIGLGTNALATAAMLKAGLKRGATGENAVCVTAQTADVIVGPIGIVLPNSMLGEITPRMAEAVASSRARKLLLPVSQNHFEFISMESKPMSQLVKEAADKIVDIAGKI
ncbi:MAG: hypothetical protein DBY32_00845 [Phascolarctobacterium sp.]|nr:MAG: hypothetical protein DBY32_00845 [Phascolarctobacterium sp.]